VKRWSGRTWEATYEATDELLAELDKLERRPPARTTRRWFDPVVQ
jgi:hypothetical protein